MNIHAGFLNSSPQKAAGLVLFEREKKKNSTETLKQNKKIYFLNNETDTLFSFIFFLINIFFDLAYEQKLEAMIGNAGCAGFQNRHLTWFSVECRD
jgi:ascorbate-specific PTS system EIIC-type component UlaA